MSLFRKKTKIFCIGQNKTGTTTISSVLKKLGYKIGSQAKAEVLISEWAKRDFRNIIKLCKTADAFQDVPFSNEFTYIILDYVFPNAKYILTVRSNKDEWYESLIRFHTKIAGKGRLPTAEDLKEYGYRYKGFLWDVQKIKYGIDETTLYDYEIYTNKYDAYNRGVKEYFKCRPNDLLTINVADADAMARIYAFLGLKYNGENMPHLNKSSNK